MFNTIFFLIFIFGCQPIDSQSSEEKVEKVLAKMTLSEKIGQMTQVEKEAISRAPKDITELGIGSILSGGGQAPKPNTTKNWVEMTDGFQKLALKSRLKIPMLYGVDAIHGHNNLKDAVIFPHFINLGATRNPTLVEAIGRATSIEVAASGARWNFAPSASVPQDLRWGRVFEAFGENSVLVSALDVAYIRGLQGKLEEKKNQLKTRVLATSKHFVGDGATRFGTGLSGKSDRGDAQIDEHTLRTKFLPPYLAAMEAGVETIMVSYSSWNGLKMHANQYLLTEVLKGEYGFKGFLISDWAALDELSSDEKQNIKLAILAGIDMVMVPTNYKSFIDKLEELVFSGDIPMSRIDDAVRRILLVKMRMGLFDEPFADPDLLDKVASKEHKELARAAVAQSQVLLKNINNVLPLKNLSGLKILVGGEGANDIGLQCGGWTIEWQGGRGPITSGVTILEGIKEAVEPYAAVEHTPDGIFLDNKAKAPIGIAVVSEKPYAEYHGDTASPKLGVDDLAMLKNMRAVSERLIVIILSGRPLLMTKEIKQADAVVASFLPGSEAGKGIADVLFGRKKFTGILPFSWPKTEKAFAVEERSEANVLFPYGFGLPN